MASTERVTLRCSAIVFRNSQVLLVRRTAQSDWVLPSGNPEPGESLASCARREVAATEVGARNPQSWSRALRPPIAGHIGGLHDRGGRGDGAYLGNVWRPHEPVMERANAALEEWEY